MQYVLPNGETVDLTQVDKVTEIKDYGRDKKKFNQRKLAFLLILRDGRTIQVEKYFHYTDWLRIIKDLRIIREEIMQQLKSLTTEKKE